MRFIRPKIRRFQGKHFPKIARILALLDLSLPDNDPDEQFIRHFSTPNPVLKLREPIVIQEKLRPINL